MQEGIIAIVVGSQQLAAPGKSLRCLQCVHVSTSLHCELVQNINGASVLNLMTASWISTISATKRGGALTVYSQVPRRTRQCDRCSVHIFRDLHLTS